MSRKPFRRTSGSGSVYKMPGRRRNPWVARVTTGWTRTIAKKGKRKGQEIQRQLFEIVGYYKTKQEGLDALIAYRSNPPGPKDNSTLSEVYADWSAYKFEEIGQSTINNYKAAWKHMAPLKDMRFRDIVASHWRKILKDCKEAGLGQSSLTKVHTLASMLYDHAIADNIVDRNYIKAVKLPKFDKVEKNRFTDIEVKRIEDAAARGTPWADVILMLIYTGFRISEFLALTRFSVDLETQIITGGQKTEAGTGRLVPIHPKILEYVIRWLDRKGDRLICKEDGSGWTSDNFRKKYYWPALKNIKGVRPLPPHSCRHTCATMLAEAGVDPLYIKEILGHTQYAFTADNYTHPSTDKLREAISKM